MLKFTILSAIISFASAGVLLNGGTKGEFLSAPAVTQFAAPAVTQFVAAPAVAQYAAPAVAQYLAPAVAQYAAPAVAQYPAPAVAQYAAPAVAQYATAPAQTYQGYHQGPIHAAIQSRRTYELRPVFLNQEPAVPQVIEVGPSEQTVQLIFRSVSSPVQIEQIHTPGQPGQIESTKSEEEPHTLIHEVYRPVIQEVREVIQPLRKIIQEVKPVIEEVHTVVAKGEPRLKAVIAPVATPVVAQVATAVATPVVRNLVTPVLNQVATRVLAAAPVFQSRYAQPLQQTLLEESVVETPLNERPLLVQSDDGAISLQ